MTSQKPTLREEKMSGEDFIKYVKWFESLYDNVRLSQEKKC